MKKKEVRNVLVVFLGILLLALIKDITAETVLEDNSIIRGEEEQEIALELKIEGEDETYEYLVEVEPVISEVDEKESAVLEQKEELSLAEKILLEIDADLEMQMQQEGQMYLQLPESIFGKQLYWEQEKEGLTIKVFLLEMIAIACIVVMQKTEEKEAKKKQQEAIIYEYPDVVNQLSVLLGAGMTARQAWIRIAKQYQSKSKEKEVEKNVLYENIVHLANRLIEGETERIAYEKFAKEVDVPCFRRLMRALVINLEKGTMGICSYLEAEEKQAYEIRILQAKKVGEETSTKMLIPLMLQMVLVMAVVLAPAVIRFMN